MFHATEDETNPLADSDDEQFLLLDGTVNLDCADDDEVPRVRGLIEILEQFLVARRS
jgi:hypothetical protein